MSSCPWAVLLQHPWIPPARFLLMIFHSLSKNRIMGVAFSFNAHTAVLAIRPSPTSMGFMEFDPRASMEICTLSLFALNGERHWFRLSRSFLHAVIIIGKYSRKTLWYHTSRYSFPLFYLQDYDNFAQFIDRNSYCWTHLQGHRVCSPSVQISNMPINQYHSCQQTSTIPSHISGSTR
jgi:hypothetical protein